MNKGASEIFKVLSVDTRLKILDLLKKRGPLGATSIAEEFDVSVSAISQHLKIMKQAKIINSKRDGFHIPYSINNEILEKCNHMLRKVCSCHHGDFPEKGEIFFKQHLQGLPIEALKEIEAGLLDKLSVVREYINKVEKE